jgi:hypothetical protein
MNRILKWCDQYGGEVTAEAIKKLFPSSSYRVSIFNYPAGTKFPGSMREGRCYVITGRCTYSFGDSNLELSTGEYANLQQGNYILTVAPEEDLEIVIVWDLSKLKRPTHR